MRTNGDKPQVWHPPRRKKYYWYTKVTAKWRRKETSGHHGHLRPGNGANTWMEFFQKQKVIEQTRHQGKKNQVIVLAGVQIIWKCLESLKSKRIKHHLTVSEQAEGRVWCEMQFLVPAPQLCSESHPRTGARFFSQFERKWLLVIFFRRMSLDVVQKVYSGVI